MPECQFFRRRAAASYLTTTYGFGSPATLAKLACIGGGPKFRKAGKIVLYEQSALDVWAQSKIGAPQASTSEARAA